ncbi:hypothetical protein TNCV_4237821, partial [Trichonephila clavipes]
VIEIDAHEIHCGKELVLHLSLAADLSTTQVTVQFVSLPPNFQEEHTVVRSGVPQHLFLFPLNHSRVFSAQRILRKPPYPTAGTYTLTNTHVFAGIRTQELRPKS